MSHSHNILFPTGPHEIRERSREINRNIPLTQYVAKATRTRDAGRKSALGAAFGENADRARALAGEIKHHTLTHLDMYLGRWAAAARAAGTIVHFATDADEANAIAVRIARDHQVRLCVKAKSMVTEEIRLVEALASIGVRAVETDLGEFILQLDGDAPSHIVTPMIHKDRRDTARIFRDALHAPYTEEPAELTAIAREHIRELYRTADMGVSGANFLLADTGSLVLCTNEGNADLSVACPKVHVAFVGIEKLIPSASHLPLFLKLLARSATAQPITVYTSIISGPARPDDPDGPHELHVVIVDNGRSRVLRHESRELLACIRCGACLNACPVYRKAGGGHAYGSVYSGPIGAVLTPELRGLASYPDLPHASSLCGACHAACPVNIDIPAHLVRLRRDQLAAGVTTLRDRIPLSIWAWVMRSPARYRVAARVVRWAAARLSSERSWTAVGPPGLEGWTASRHLPVPATQSFRDWWRERADRGRGGYP